MSRDRALLALSKLDDFAAWAAGEGYAREATKGPYEVLRLRKVGAAPIIYYARSSATQHATAYGKGVGLVRRWIRLRNQPTGEKAMPDNKAQSKASYAAALTVWRDVWKSASDRKPMATSFGLTDAEAADIEANGYDTSILPKILQPRQGSAA